MNAPPAAYVYEVAGGEGGAPLAVTLLHKLTHPEGGGAANPDDFAHRVAISDDGRYLAAGTSAANTVYVFGGPTFPQEERYTLLRKITLASVPDISETVARFGSFLAFSGDCIAIAAPVVAADDGIGGSLPRAGKVCLFQNSP